MVELPIDFCEFPYYEVDALAHRCAPVEFRRPIFQWWSG